MGNSIVQGLSKPPKLSQKEHDAITAMADKMFAGSREELANAGFGVTAKKANQQTATNLNTVRSNVIDSDVAFSLGYSDYSLSYDSNADLSTKAYYAAQSNELTSNLSSDLHYRENKFLSQMWQITAAGDAAYQAGLNRGYVSAAMGRPDALNSLAMQKQSMIDFAVMNQQQYAYDQANPMGTWSDLAIGMGKGLVDSLYQGVQFLGTSVAALTPLGQGISYATGNGALNPFDVEYHSMFDAPTNRMDAAGRFMGEVASVFAGGEGLLIAGAKGINALSKANVATDTVSARRAYLNNKHGRTGDINVDINIRGNMEVATNFYRQSGYSDLDMTSHLNGINFTQPVEVVKIGKGQSLYQWDSPTTFRGGEYFSFLERSTPSQLGINPQKIGFGTDTVFTRMQAPLVTSRAVYGLRSIAAPINDTWSVRYQPFMTQGGAPQLFTTDISAFKLNSWKYYGK